MTNNTKSEFTAENAVTVCGKIIGKRYDAKSMELIVTLSIDCGNKKRKKNEKGQIIRDLVSVRFFNITALNYNEHFKKGDFVQISGVAQNVRNVYYRTSQTEIWGYDMRYRSSKNHDKNKMCIRGKIESSKVISSNYILVNVITQTEKKAYNPNNNSNVETFEQKYRSVTAIGIRCKGDARNRIKSYTPGTWIKCSGFIDVRNVAKGNKVRREMRLISLKTDVIGQIQRVKVI